VHVLAALHALEWSFISLLLLMTAATGLIALVVVVRVVEPAGLKALLLRLRGKPTRNFHVVRRPSE
jgi:hypothetical protein